MISAIDATAKALFQILDGQLGGAGYYAEVPEDQPPPVVIGGNMDAEKIGGKDADPDRRIFTTLTTIVAGDSRAALSTIQARIEELLDEQAVEVSGFSVSFTVDSSTSDIGTDGAGWVGSTNLTIFALQI